MAGDRHETEVRDELRTFLLWHKALRTDAARLAATLAGDEPVDAAQLATWFAAYGAALNQHATSEDEVLWPAVDALANEEFPEGVEAVTTHEDVEAAACAMAVALELLIVDPASRSGAATMAQRFAEVLNDHLVFEEQVVVPRALEIVGRTRWLVLEEQARSDAGPQMSAFVFPWLAAHADADELAALLSWLPGSAPVVLAERLGPSYRRLTSALVPAV
jgi:hemerythrin-like domain-containing protein